MSKKVYLANPYGFSLSQRFIILPELMSVIKSTSKKDIIEIWEPFDRNNQIDFSDKTWAYKVGQADVNDVLECDAIFAVLNGNPPDEGVCVELGIVIGYNRVNPSKKKGIFLYRDDFRKCTDSGEYPLNLMLFTDLPEHSWEDHYYTSFADIHDPQKAFYKWVNS